MHESEPVLGGAPLIDAGNAAAPYALVLLHGRGGTAEGMLPIARAAGATDAAWIAPRADGNSWYPLRFLVPIEQNEPALASALIAVDRAVAMAVDAGIPSERVLLIGFSQGACLALEYATHTARRVAGVAALAGALMGDEQEQATRFSEPARGGISLQGTPVLLASGDADDHIPVHRVRDAAETLAALGAAVDLRIYEGVTHQIVADEIGALRSIVSTMRSTRSAVVGRE
jgi:predicted esterase